MKADPITIHFEHLRTCKKIFLEQLLMDDPHLEQSVTSVEVSGFIGWITSAAAYGEPSSTRRVL